VRLPVRWKVLVGGLLVVGLGSGATAARAGAARYPVPWTFTPGVVAGATEGPDVAPPGSNVPCRPSPAHPEPVVLVHGLGADQSENWQTLAPFLADNGYCVFSLTYGVDPGAPAPFAKSGGLADMTASARQLGSFVAAVLARTGARKVDLVGHSEGGTMPDWYLKFLGGWRHVDHFVLLAGALHGTDFWGTTDLYRDGQSSGASQAVTAPMARSCTACFQFFPFSPFMRALDDPHARGGAPSCAADGAAVDGVRYTSVATTNDELVRPATSGFLSPRCAGTTDLLVQDQCPTDQSDHVSLAADPVAATDVLNALDPSHRRAVPCTLVLPGLGAPVYR
jgi:triacylglycerol lipase